MICSCCTADCILITLFQKGCVDMKRLSVMFDKLR